MDFTPFYQNIKSSTTSFSDDLTAEQRDEFISLIKSLDEQGHELVYVLIRMFERDTSDKISETPYCCKITTKDVSFEFDAIPLQLKWMIYKFSKLHADKMVEESTRTKLIGCRL
jgi:hypothetical protein